MLIILIFPVFSSSISQYLLTILPFLTKLSSLKTSVSFAILNFSCSISPFIIGILLYYNLISNKLFKLKNMFYICIILFLLMLNKLFFISIILNFLYFGILSGYIVCMQVKTNSLTNYADLGKFIILRNSLISFFRIIFSFIASYLYKNVSLSVFYFFAFLLFMLFYLFFLLNKKYSD